MLSSIPGNRSALPALSVAALTAAAVLVPSPAAAAQTTKLTLQTSVRTDPTKPVRLSGRLTFGGKAPGSPQQITLTRSRDGKVTWTGKVTTKADGTFTHTDGKLAFGVFVYTAQFEGTDQQNPARANATTRRRVPGDINRDGRADLRIGAPARTVNGLPEAGALAVTPGSPSGATGRPELLVQGGPKVPDTPEKEDLFGFSHTSGDFNGDGYGDVAVGAPGENGRGSVTVLYGSAEGLSSSGSTVLLRSGLSAFGFSLTALDANNDGYDDLAVGVPGQGSKSVMFYLGGAQGVGRVAPLRLRPGLNGVPGKPHAWESFGHELNAGDFDGDGYDDLAVGDPFDWSPKYGTYGSVVVLYGRSGQGGSFRFRKAQFWDKDSPGVQGTVGRWKKDAPDYFGWALGVADFNGDGRDDLAVSAPGSPVKRSGKTYQDAGTIHVLYGASKGLTASGDQLLTLDTPGVPGAAKTGDLLGVAMRGGDATGDGRAELAIGGQGRQMVVVLRGAKKALTTTNARWLTQNTKGVPGSTQKNGFFGAFLSFLHLRGPRIADLVVGAPGTSNQRGSVTILPRALPTGSYLAKLPSAQPGDQFGVVLAPTPTPLTPANPTGQNRPPA